MSSRGSHPCSRCQPVGSSACRSARAIRSPRGRESSNWAMARARLAQARQALEEYTVRAPQAGTVLRLLAAPGEVLSGQARQPVVLFCPDAPRVVRAEVDQEFAARLAAGQPALVEDDVRS